MSFTEALSELIAAYHPRLDQAAIVRALRSAADALEDVGAKPGPPSAYSGGGHACKQP